MEYERTSVFVMQTLQKLAEQKGIPSFDNPNQVIHDSLDTVEFIVHLEEFIDKEIDDEMILGIDTSTFQTLIDDIHAILSRGS